MLISLCDNSKALQTYDATSSEIQPMFSALQRQLRATLGRDSLEDTSTRIFHIILEEVVDGLKEILSTS